MIVQAVATGQYPTEVLEVVEKNSKKEGLSVGRIQQFSQEEQEIIKGNNNMFTRTVYLDSDN